MPNLLAVPVKRSHPADVRSALRSYIHQKHPETHPDAFAWDISKWEDTRREAITNEFHEERVPKIIAYHAQLAFALTKLPANVGLSFTYDAMYTPGVTLALPNIAYERLCVLLNLVALFSGLANGEDRSSAEGIKRAVVGFARAAGTISYIISTALPAFLKTMEGASISLPPEFDESTLTSFRFLLLAQGQECAWQKANADKLKDGILARLAAEASSLYNQSLQAINRNPAIAATVPKSWTSHITAKMNHFDAVAQYRTSMDDEVARRYGLQISRLQIASAACRRSIEAAQKRGVAPAVLDDAKSLEAILKTSLKRADHDNDLIYHQDVPAASSTPSIQGTAIVREEPVPGLTNPAQSVAGGDELIFAGLEGWGITRAVEIYRNRRDNWINDELIETQHELDQAAASSLSTMHLPASLDALSQPIGLPPSLLTKAEQVRQEDGPTRLKKMFKDVKMLADQGHTLIESCFDILDLEAQEDDDLQKAYARYDEWSRPASQDANKHLTDELKRHNRMLSQAKTTDKFSKQNWQEWQERINQLAQDQATLEEMVPKTTYSPREALSSTSRNTTQVHAVELRRLLEQLDDLRLSRMRILERAKRTAASDDIKPRILRHAAAFSKEQWVDIDPATFGEVIDTALAKYDDFKGELEANQESQVELLVRIQEQNEKFLESRKVDPSIKDREAALQSLDAAYMEYLNIKRHLEEGIRFYNDFAGAVGKIKTSAQEWVDERHASIKWLLDSLDPVGDLDEDEPAVNNIEPAVIDPAPTPTVAKPIEVDDTPVEVTPVKTRTKRKGKATAQPVTSPEETVEPAPMAAPAPMATPSRKQPLRLPNPNSSAWQTTELPPAPLETPGSTRKTRSRAKETA